MFRNMFKSKIHRATVTDADLNYNGSITIDSELLEASGILPYEQVHVVNINNGNRFETYVIEGKPGSGEICINGAAARLVHSGDLVIIITYSMVPENELNQFEVKTVLVDSQNKIVRINRDKVIK
ncbi:aspartate 1-decarboxylase [Candidatus Contubernalis alkaliaceticus]|uniref:aspartate 1-decarboxylase n=1 Tax=Candidatus Contubernalis alkaliaceticus TaxID=338645 RepID=UPI001F4C3C12|nr:aspartate 1-decarboxylase [Candidatus Contubernalis alkalaceticus]UNC91815.1 aspartate 1-decarboxylase [Candidatus Contubernalis alkalaceticus]